MYKEKILIRHLGLQHYETILKSMRNFTDTRNRDTMDEIWLVEHFPVFTKGRSERSNQLLSLNGIPVIQSDRGGKITYHGPGQQIMYVLLNLKRRNLNVRELVALLEKTVINILNEYKIDGYSSIGTPGVYVMGKKICSIGLRIYKGYTSHGLALNVNMDLSPFLDINPCGYSGMKMTQMCHWNPILTPIIIRFRITKHFLILLENPPYEYISTST